MKKILKTKLDIIIARYEKLHLDTSVYRELKKLSGDDTWLTKQAAVLSRIENSEKIFDVSKQINLQKNDVRLDEAFAELDTGRNLATTGFYGSFDKVTYLAQEKNKRWPDFIAENKNGITPIEVKLLTPQYLSEAKFFQKFIDKINNHAVPQLNSFYLQQQFERGFIFVWSYRPVQLQNLDYFDLKKWVESQVPKQKFTLTLLCNFYQKGMWDFTLEPLT